MKKDKIIMIAIAVVICGVSFYGGMKYGQSSANQNDSQSFAGSNGSGQFGGTGGRMRMGGRNGAGGIVAGDIVSLDSTSMTVSLRSGGSKNVLLSQSTEIQKSTTGTYSDLASGEQVMVMGTPNADGSLTAQSIQIRPAGFGKSATSSNATN
jgi:hypothetical protein